MVLLLSLVIWLVILFCVVSSSIGVSWFWWCRLCRMFRLLWCGSLMLSISRLNLLVISVFFVVMLLVIYFMVLFFRCSLVWMLLLSSRLFLVSSIFMVVLF